MTFVRRRGIALTLEDMSKMSATVGADDLGPTHAQSTIGVTSDSARNGVEEGWPAAAGSKLVVGPIEWSVAGRTSVDPGRRHMLVILARKWCFRSLFAQNTELL